MRTGAYVGRFKPLLASRASLLVPRSALALQVLDDVQRLEPAKASDAAGAVDGDRDPPVGAHDEAGRLHVATVAVVERARRRRHVGGVEAVAEGESDPVRGRRPLSVVEGV